MLLSMIHKLAFCRATAREIASAMSYLHSLDILHGDLSGGNILLASSDIDARNFTAKVTSTPTRDH